MEAKKISKTKLVAEINVNLKGNDIIALMIMKEKLEHKMRSSEEEAFYCMVCRMLEPLVLEESDIFSPMEERQSTAELIDELIEGEEEEDVKKEKPSTQEILKGKIPLA